MNASIPTSSTARVGTGLSLVGVAAVLLTHWMVFFWVPTEATQGFMQRIYYLHVPAAWVTELAFALAALCGCMYLWLGDERADAAAVAVAEGGLFFCLITLVAGPLWGRLAWGTFWAWEPRLTFTLLLFFIFVGYFMVRGAVEDAERAKRVAAVVAIVGVLDIPLIHMSVYWFRSLHPQPVVMRAGGPTADAEIVLTVLVAAASYTTLFAGLASLRYAVELCERGALIGSRDPMEAAG